MGQWIQVCKKEIHKHNRGDWSPIKLTYRNKLPAQRVGAINIEVDGEIAIFTMAKILPVRWRFSVYTHTHTKQRDCRHVHLFPVNDCIQKLNPAS